MTKKSTLIFCWFNCGDDGWSSPSHQHRVLFIFTSVLTPTKKCKFMPCFRQANNYTRLQRISPGKLTAVSSWQQNCVSANFGAVGCLCRLSTLQLVKLYVHTFFTSNRFLLAPLLVPLGVSTSIAAAILEGEIRRDEGVTRKKPGFNRCVLVCQSGNRLFYSWKNS